MRKKIQPSSKNSTILTKEIFQNKSILIVNTGTIKKKFIFQKLKKLGLNILVINKEKNWADPYVNHWILADTTNHNESLRAISEFLHNNPSIKLDGALTFWEDDVLLNSKIVDKFNLVGIPFSIAKKARNKFLFREFCAKNNIRTPKHCFINSRKNLKYIENNFDFPIVIKPVFGSMSAYVVKVDSIEDLHNAYEYVNKNISANIESSLSDGLDIFAEEYIDGDEVDIDILIQSGKIKFYSISDNNQTNEPFFVETGQSIPSGLPERDQEALIELAEETLEKLGVQNGCIHFEAKSTNRGPVPIEVNLRMGGDEVHSFVKGAWGVDLVENAVKIALGIYIPKIKRRENPLKYISGVYFLTENSGILTTWDVDAKIKKNKHVEELHFYKQIGDVVLVPPDGYEYLGWITISGDNPIDAEDNLNHCLKYIRFNVAKFDTDSSVGKTSRRNRFSSAVLNKDLLMRKVKMEHIKNTSKKNQKDLHIGILGNIYDNHDAFIEETLIKRGYKVTYFDFNNLQRCFNSLRQSDVDLVFNVCGVLNNQGGTQAHAASLLETMQVPYTGSNYLTLSLCNDKINVKKLLAFHDIPTPKWDCAFTMDDEINENLQYPLIVKPAHSDNSFGITNESVVMNKKELNRQLKKIIVGLRQPALVEEYIEGDEYDVPIIGRDGTDYQVLPLSRSIFKSMPEGYWHIYTFEAKWQNPALREQIQVQRPAKNLNRRLESLISEIALDAYSILDCQDYGRVEIRVDQFNNPYVLEINPNTSLHPKSSIPEVAKLIDLDYGDLLEQIINSAIRAYKQKPSEINSLINFSAAPRS